MSALVLPDRVAKDMLVDQQLAIGREFTRMLQQIDRRLSCVLAKDQVGDPRLVPGCWHFRRVNDGTEPSYMAITTPDGGYREPALRDIEELQRRDLWRDFDQFQRARLERENETARAQALASEQRRDEFAANFATALRVPGDGGLTKRRWARGGASK
jgi:hypothetical protein